eukprot:maker-scaffold204_size260821-snap-gene-1.41 protein:Tk07822 transcript:maker-scaffold204_size260821-snap-gene-1.41-mRNA-1 annotation:"Peflin"
MSGYPGGGGYPQQGGYGVRPSYPGGAPSGGGGYPGGGGGAPPSSGGYPGAGAPPSSGGYPGGAAPPTSGGYPGGGYSGGYQGQGGTPTSSGGGFPAGGARPPAFPGAAAPPVDPNIAQWFNAVDQDRSGSITAPELQKALVNGNWSHFSEEACRMMIDMFDRDRNGTINVYEFGHLFNYINQWKGLFENIDRDRSGFIEYSELQQDIFDKNASGTIDFNEFQQLFNYINQWKSLFESFDKDRSGRIEESELLQAFQQMGYRFTPTFVQNLLAKYDPRTRKLTLDNFIMACVQIKRLTDSFRSRDREMRGQATFQYEDFVGLAMGAHK